MSILFLNEGDADACFDAIQTKVLNYLKERTKKIGDELIDEIDMNNLFSSKD